VAAVFAVGLLYPARALLDAMHRVREGAGGFASLSWQESETIRYVLDHAWLRNGKLFTNSPGGLYFLADIGADWSPAKVRYNSRDLANEIEI
jgi:hypothetical protein